MPHFAWETSNSQHNYVVVSWHVLSDLAMIELRLKTVLTEYESLRNEIMSNMRIRTEMTAIVAGFSGVIATIALSSNEPLAFAVLPLAITIWAFMVYHSYDVHLRLSKHLVREIRPRIAELIGCYREDDWWMSWDTERLPPRLELVCPIPLVALVIAILLSGYLTWPFHLPSRSILWDLPAWMYFLDAVLAVIATGCLCNLWKNFDEWAKVVLPKCGVLPSKARAPSAMQD